MRKLLLRVIFLTLLPIAFACNDAKVKDLADGEKTEKNTDSKDSDDTENNDSGEENSKNKDENEESEGSRPSASSIAQKWCDLNGKVYRATSEASREKAQKALTAYEQQIESRYGDDEAFMKKIEKAAEECEGESEGRN